MEKINKEELMKKLNLTEEDLEKVAGGETLDECYTRVDRERDACLANCRERGRACRHNCYSTWEHERFVCHASR